jgi:hypothetical protein
LSPAKAGASDDAKTAIAVMDATTFDPRRMP